MFDNPRYITKGFQSTIPITTQLILYHMIDHLEKTHVVDYLQVFELSVEKHNGTMCQKVVHSQEQPAWLKTTYFPLKELVTAKVFVIDDEDHHTFLLAEEY